MADVQSNIKVSIDTTEALASIKNLQRQISAFHTSMAKSGAAANAVTGQMQQNLINSINATGKFSAQMRTIRTTTESFTNSLEKNKFSMGEYFRYAGGASKSFGKLFKTEFETINKVARENVKDLQTQYIKMGRDANGAMKSIAVRPLSLDMNNLATKTMIASEKQAILNQLLKQGSTNLLNFGKNTQWAGRQLMVGFTIPLVALGAAASKTFMDMETQAIRFKKVYGDLFTSTEETAGALDAIKNLGKEFTKYGVAVSQTVGLASEAAAAGFKGLDLQRQTAAATKLSILGQVESQKALETTIALQNAFSMSSEDLATNIDFLNAVENQTVLSLDDISTAIPKAAPVIQQLGGDVKDLAFFMAAMKEGGINASEGANALKSGLASMINPTAKASAMLSGLGINIKKIVVDNKGDLKKTVVDFATALNQLDPLNRAQAIEQMFGKFQFARLSTLFANVTKEGTQASRVLDLAGSSIQDLAALSEKELGQTSESTMVKFKASIENLKLSLVPLGEQFLKIVTPIAEFVTKMLDKFNNLGDGTKKIIVLVTGVVAGLGPVLLMTFGLLMNGLANIIKGFTFMKSLFNKTGQASATLGTEVKYMTTEQRNAAAVAASLDQVHKKLAQTFSSEAASVDALTRAYQRSIAAQSQFMPSGMPLGRGPIKKRAKGKPSTVGGTGNQDSELAYLMPGETVIPTDMSKKYGALINGMIADNIPGYGEGKKRAQPIFNQKMIDELYASIGLEDTAKIRIPLPTTSPSYSVSGIMAPKTVNTKKGGIGMDKQYLSSPMGRDALSASIQVEIEALGTSAKRTSQVLNEISPQLDTAVNEFDDTIEGWKKASAKAIKNIESSKTLTPQEKSAIRKRLAPIDPTDYTVPSDPVLEIKKQGSTGGKGKGTPRNERKDSAYRDAAQKKILKAKGYDTEGLVFAHMPGYEKIEGQQRATMRPPTAGGKILTGDSLARVEAVRQKVLLNKGFSKAELDKIAKEDAASYKAALERGTQDPYVSSRDRKSPHRLAAKDGKDDAVAYNKAREKEENKNNRKRRSASRKQGAPLTVIPASAADPRVIPFSDANPQIIPQVIPPGYTPPEGPMHGPRKPNRYDKTFGKVAAKFRDPDGKFKGRGMGMGLSTAAMMGSQFIPGKAGDVVQKVSMIGFALSALQPVVTGLATALGVTVGAVVGVGALLIGMGAGLYLFTKSAKKSAEEIKEAAKKEAEARLGSARAIEQFGKTFNKSLPSAREFSRNNRQSIKASGTQVEAFAKDYATKGNIDTQIINQAALKGKDSGINAVALSVANRAAIYGLSPEEISANIKAASDLIGADQVKVKLAVQKLLSPDGKDILKEPLSLDARINFLNKQSNPLIENITKSIDDLSKIKFENKNPLSGETFDYKSMESAAGSWKSITDSWGGDFWDKALAVGKTWMYGVTEGLGALKDPTNWFNPSVGIIKEYTQDLATPDVVEEFAAMESRIQTATVQLSIAFIQQKEALALLNTQYSDGLITKEKYDEQMAISGANFNSLEKSSLKLIKGLMKIDKTGGLADSAIKDLGDQALATLKKSNPELFDKITTSLDKLSKSARINVYMGYAQGSLTIMDLALIPDILKSIEGKTYEAAIKIINKSDLSDGGKAVLTVPMAEQKLKELQDYAKKQNYLDVPTQRRLADAKAQLAAAKKAEAEAAKVNQKGNLDTDLNKYKDLEDGTGKVKSATEKYLEVLQKEIDALKAKRDAQKDANDEVQREIDLRNKLQDLANQAVEAKISGNYIKASMLTQESQNVQMKYNQETELRKKDAEIARLEARYKAIEDGAKLTKAETAKIPKKAAGGSIKGPGTSKSDSIPAYLSNGEYVVQASSVAKYGVGFFDSLNAQKFGGGSLGSVAPVTNPRPAKTSPPKMELWDWERAWQEANKQVVKVPTPAIKTNFATNSFALNKEQRLELQAIAKELIAAQVKAIIVQGHTDSVGSGKDNKVLSQNRANAIAEYISKFVPGTGFVPVGYGEYKPLVPNTTAENRARNRRAELIMPDKYKTIYPEFQPAKHRWIINLGKLEGGGSIEGGGMMTSGFGLQDSFKPTPKPKKTEQPKRMLVSGFANGGLANYRLPSYEVGSPYIPKDQIAQLHKGERVLTAEENKNFTTSGPITNIININGSDLNKKEIATAVMVELDRAQKKNNKTNMVNN